MQQLTNVRELRGFTILSDPENIKQIRKNVWYVRSQSNKDIYFRVERNWPKGYGTWKYVWSCTCPDHVNRKQICKHIYAVEFSLKPKIDIEQETTHQEVAYITSDVVCPTCQSVSIVRDGCRVTRFGRTQRYTCKDCGRRFTPDKGFKNMKHDPKIITLTLDLYFKGVSLRKIVDHLKQFHDIEVSQTTPMRWIKKYIKLLGKYVEKYKADVGRVWHADEMTVFLKKKGEKRYYEWIWNVIDAETRYLLACHVTKDRYVADAKMPLMQAKSAAARRPDLVVTDGLQAYQYAIKDVFYDKSAFIHNPHFRLKNFETKPNNNIVEQLNGTVRERTKVMRSLPNQIGASEFCAGMQVYYNYNPAPPGNQGDDSGTKGPDPSQPHRQPLDDNDRFGNK